MQNLFHFKHSRTIILLCFIALYMFAASLIAPAQTVRATAAEIRDGDTVVLQFENGFQFDARLIGIDAPELTQSYGQQAKTELEEMIVGEELRVLIVAEDRYNRKLVYLFRNDYFDVNVEMLNRGAAWRYSVSRRNSKMYRAAEKSARITRRGLWQESAPCPPRKWRIGKCPGQ